MTPESRELSRLTAEIGTLTDVLRRQNRLRQRLFVGLFFGVGTAIGASVIATLLIFGFMRVLQIVGVTTTINPVDVRNSLELQFQSPSDPTTN